ncbi:hypothetical protein [Rhizobium sp. RCC_161_2]|uniref:endonuclease/exonuclease/phosphatase family protein n=1 Tax=Rhizobium sp. RCC_161_2 TaxID=3239219 RepID=UPI003525E083
MTPPKGNALPGGEHALVLEVIVLLLTECHVVCLGEVSSADLDWLADRFSGTPFAVQDMTQGGRASKFNLGVIYNEEVATFIGNEFNIPNIGGDNYKISCRMDFVIYGEDYFSFLVSHWPSRLLKRDDAEIRGHYGAALRKEVEDLQSDGVKYLVVLGDFNDEPFNHSMTTFLRGCRDASFVNSNPDLLYNPFWKQIVSPRGYIKSPGPSDPTGTYFYRSDNLHRWRVFDQMLFCSAFVGGSEWHLNEKETGVFRYERLVEAVESSRSKLDHLPIIAELNKDATNG